MNCNKWKIGRIVVFAITFFRIEQNLSYCYFYDMATERSSSSDPNKECVSSTPSSAPEVSKEKVSCGKSSK